MTVDLLRTPPPIGWGVTVHSEAIEAMADAWAGTEFPLPAFDYPGTPEHREEDFWFDYVTLAVSVLACLWPPEGDDVWRVEHDGAWLDDAPGVFAAFSKKMVSEQRGIDWFADMSVADGQALFAGRGTLQLVDERVEILRSVAGSLQQRWQGSARNLVASANRDGREIVRLLSETITAFNDRPTTRAGVAHFDKLAHLAAALMAAGMDWSSSGFHGYDEFPVYPDYMLPRVFRHYGVMAYAVELGQRVDNRLLVVADSVEEHAIRWATVHSGELLRNALAVRGTHVTGPALDYRLWSIAVLGPEADHFGEHHRTLTMKY